MSTTLGCKDIKILKSAFVAKIQFPFFMETFGFLIWFTWFSLSISRSSRMMFNPKVSKIKKN